MSKTIVVIKNQNGAYQDEGGERFNLFVVPDGATVATKKPTFSASSLSEFCEEKGFEKIQSDTPLDKDTPEYDRLIESGIETNESALEWDLTEIKGIGPATAKKIVNHINSKKQGE
jgi:hypothetical protein